MTQLTDNGVFAYPVPEGCHSPYIINSANGNGQGLFFKRDGDKSPPYVVLPPGSYEFLFCTKGCSEEDARRVVTAHGKHFRDYERNFYTRPLTVFTAIESLDGLLRSKGCDQTQNYALIKRLH
jgi:hypothetical protein